MNKSNYKQEVLNEISEKRTKIYINQSDTSDNIIECGCTDHVENATLREGNRIFAVIIKQEDAWTIKDTTCWQCSIRDIVERITDDIPIALVEGTLEKPSIEDDNTFCIMNPKVWEILTPAK